MTARTVSADDLETLARAAHADIEFPGPEGGWAVAVINGRSYRARVGAVPERKTPEQWCAELGARIADPDGWRDGTRGWDEPITREEFDRRLLICTIDSRGYPEFRGLTSEPTP